MKSTWREGIFFFFFIFFVKFVPLQLFCSVFLTIETKDLNIGIKERHRKKEVKGTKAQRCTKKPEGSCGCVISMLQVPVGFCQVMKQMQSPLVKGKSEVNRKWVCRVICIIQGVQVASAELNLEKLLFFGCFGLDCSNS